jgi:hypothetical protein
MNETVEQLENTIHENFCLIHQLQNENIKLYKILLTKIANNFLDCFFEKEESKIEKKYVECVEISFFNEKKKILFFFQGTNEKAGYFRESNYSSSWVMELFDLNEIQLEELLLEFESYLDWSLFA